MKVIISITITSVLFLIYSFGNCQTNFEEIGNFKFDKNERIVSWVKVFESSSDVDITKAKNYFEQNQILEILSTDSSSLIGKFNSKPIDIQKYGYKRGTTPMYLLDVEQVFNVKLEFKDGKYRATLNQMGYIDNGVLSDLTSRALVGNTATSSKGNLVSYDGDFSFTNKNEVRTRNLQGLEILDKFYTDILTFKDKDISSSDW